MKKRVFMGMDNSVFRVVIATEDWSEGDLKLMYQFGEPEINVGGDIHYVCPSHPDEGVTEAKEARVSAGGCVMTNGNQFVRVLHGFPYSRGFDSRDFSCLEEAVAVGKAWKDMVLDRIDEAVIGLRQNSAPLPTEEVTEI